MPDAGAEMRLEWTSEFPIYTTEATSATCLLSLVAPSLSRDALRAPVSISLVIDRSGSMSGSKLTLVKETMQFLLTQLTARDSVSVVAYDTQVTTVHPLVKTTAENKAAIAAAVQQIVPGSSTNLSGGLFSGLQQQLDAAAAAAPPSDEDWALVDTPGTAPPATVQSVFLFTDGLANAGLTSAADITRALRNLLATSAAGSALKVHTFGFGADHDSDMLGAISGAANGTYYYITGPDRIPEAFADALGGLLSVVAQNGALTVTPGAGCTLAAVRAGLDARAVAGGGTAVDVRDLYAEERRDVVVEVELPAAAAAEATSEAAVVEFAFMDVIAGALVKRTAALQLRRGAVGPERPPPNELVALHRARLDAAARMREAVALADGGRHGDARALLDREVAAVASLLAASVVSDGDSGGGSRAALEGIRGDLQRCARQVGEERGYAMRGKRFATAQLTRLGAQRSTGMGYAPPMRAAAGASAPGVARQSGLYGPPPGLDGTPGCGPVGGFGSAVAAGAPPGMPIFGRVATAPRAMAPPRAMAAHDDLDDIFDDDMAATSNPYATRAQTVMVQRSRQAVLGESEPVSGGGASNGTGSGAGAAP